MSDTKLLIFIVESLLALKKSQILKSLESHDESDNTCSKIAAASTLDDEYAAFQVRASIHYVDYTRER